MNKTCAKCHVEQEEKEFPRRGNSTGAWCKTCMREYANARYQASKNQTTLPPTKEVKKISQEAGRIAELSGQIAMIAASYFPYDSLQADDCASYITEWLLLNTKAEHNRSYILGAARSRAQDFIRKINAYDYYVTDITGSGDDEDDSDGFEVLNLTPDQPRQIEDEISMRETMKALAQVVKSLSPENQQVVRLLSLGYKQAEIAREMKLSEAAISTRVSRIAQSIQSLQLS